MPEPAAIPWHSTRLALDALVRLGTAPAFDPATLPAYTAAIPDLLRLAGISALTIPGAPSCRWIGQGGGEVALNQPAPDASIHRGHLPCSAHLIDAAQWRADEVMARGADADALLGVSGHAGMGAGNGLPWRHRAVVEFALDPADPALLGLLDHRGISHPVQLHDPDPEAEEHGGVRDQGLRALVSVELDPLAATTFTPAPALVPGARWEVSARVLDNGRVRAEFDDVGRIVRICWDGTFAQPAGPWLAAAAGPPLDPGAIVAGAAVMTVRESGPVRATIAWTITLPHGLLMVTYRLQAFSDALEISVSWHGSGPLTLHHPTRHHLAGLDCGDERSRWTVPQAASAIAGPVRTCGLRHAALTGGDGRGVAMAFDGPTSVVACDGDLRLELAADSSLSYALIAAARPADSLSRLQTALGIFGPHLLWSGPPCASPLRPALPPGTETLWLRPAGDWDGELLVTEQSLARARCFFYVSPGRRQLRAIRVDARGTVLDDLEATPEGDGWILDLEPGAVAIVRWHCD